MAVINLYNKTARGTLFITGNTLGLSKLTGALQPGDVDSIGGFITTDITITTPAGWAATTIPNLANKENITVNWQENSSSAYLNMMSGYTIDYAVLYWSGVQVNNSVSPSYDLTTVINNAIWIKAPDGTVSNITPDSANNQDNIANGTGPCYARSSDITNIIRTKGAGEYTVGRIPSAILGADDTSNFAGWCIIVAALHPLERYRNLKIYSLGEAVSTGNDTTITVTGFNTPSSGPVDSRILIAAGAGNANNSGDSIFVGPNAGAATITVSGPNNREDNFFGSQINNNMGQLDISGTFGGRNQNPETLMNIVAGRQGFDVTNVSAGNGFVNNQNQVAFRFNTTNDGYAVLALGIQIDANEPILEPIVKTESLSTVSINDYIDYTIRFTNTGNVSAEHCVFIDTIPNGTNYVPNTYTINGSNIPGPTTPQNPYTLGTIGSGTGYTITFRVQVVTIPSPNPIVNRAYLGYDFIGIVGQPRVYASLLSMPATATLPHPIVSATKTVDKPYINNVNGELNYTLFITNTGNTATTTISFVDTIPVGTTFVPGSLYVNGSPVSGSLTSGVNITNGLAVNQGMTLTFKVNVNTLPSAVLNNRGELLFTSGVGRMVVDSNIATTTVTAPLLNINKTTSNYSKCFDILTYTIAITNSGNLPALNVDLFDTIPNGISFIADSVNIDNVNSPGVDPSFGIMLGTINQGTTTTISFKGRVDCILP